jgi:hypothetical protein
LIAQLPGFREEEVIVDTDATSTIEFREGKTTEELFEALSLGLRDYLRKCNFKSAVLGLSGGVDSAVVAAIAVDALGAENVVGVSMPSPYSRAAVLTMPRARAQSRDQMSGDSDHKCVRGFQAQFAEIFKGLPKTRPRKTCNRACVR